MSLGHGGAERHSMALAQLLAPHCRVVLVTLKPDDALLAGRTEPLPFETPCLDVRRRIDRDAAARLAAILDRHGVDTVLCANTYPLLYAHLAAGRAARRPRIVEIYHTTRLLTWKQRLDQVFYRPFFWRSDELVYVCHAQRRYWSRRLLWARRVRVIYNGIDLSRFAERREPDLAARAAYGLGADDHVIGVCAVLRPEKAHLDLLRAAARARDAGRRWKLLLIGDGPMRPQIEAEAARLGLQDDLRITGYLSDVRDAIAACDVMALVSVAIETFSIAALESMAIGKPMIMSDIGGAREQVEPGRHGWVFPAGDVAALTERLGEAWDLARLRTMGAAARQRVASEFSQERMTQAYLDLLEGR